MKRTTVVLLAMLVLAGCGSSPAPSTATSTPGGAVEPGTSSAPPPAPTVPADGGMTGTWSGTDPKGTISVAFDSEGTSAAAKAAQACLVAMKGDPITWVVITTENTSGAQLTFNGLTLVTGDGQQLKPDNAISTMNDLYGDAPDGPAREKCRDTAVDLAKLQLENGLAPGAKATVLQSVPASVKSIKSVTVNGSGQTLTLTYA